MIDIVDEILYSELEDKTILIIGASGYIGTTLVEKFVNYKCTIVRMSRDKARLKKIESSKASIIDTDSDISSVLLAKIEIIYYLSSQTSVYVAQQDLSLDYHNSVAPVLKIFNMLKELKTRPIFIFASAATICGLTTSLPVDETTPDNPITVYDIHKLLIEKYLKYYIDINVISGSILRLANVYGSGVKSSSSDRGILNIMINKSLNNEDLTLYGNGNYIRDYVYIDDVINAFLQVTINIDKTNSKFYYIGSGIGITLKNAFSLIKDVALDLYKCHISIKNIEIPPDLSSIEMRNFYADLTNFKSDTTWSPNIQLKEGIIKTMNKIKKS